MFFGHKEVLKFKEVNFIHLLLLHLQESFHTT